jgi:N-methylhydantoinase A/oxoprolinase/acetone carboxylase beta subunit
LPAHVRRPAWFGGRPIDAAIYRWEDLPFGAAGTGPAIVAGAGATAVIPPAFRFRIDEFGNVVAVRGSARPPQRARARTLASAP